MAARSAAATIRRDRYVARRRHTDLGDTERRPIARGTLQRGSRAGVPQAQRIVGDVDRTAPVAHLEIEAQRASKRYRVGNVKPVQRKRPEALAWRAQRVAHERGRERLIRAPGVAVVVL